MEQIFNVPRFIHAIDNKGNDFSLDIEKEQGQFVDRWTRGKGDLYIGECLVIEVEVDESFSDFTIEWFSFNGDRGNGKVAIIAIEPKHVGIQMDVRFELRSKETWHRLHGGIDDMLDIRYRVFPPTQAINDAKPR
ncbi:hypothetical protein J2S22_002088 [Rhodoplanes tepidamans]|nr:hypothetical protein [Rhodoplanes tepidamans]